MTAPLLQTGSGRPLETTRLFTPLGIRFFDRALDVAVGDGLRVQAIHVSGAYAPVVARRAQSGVYAFHGLPLLRDLEYPRAEPEPSTFVPTHDFVITVDDTLGRFLPMLFVVRLPLPYRGVFLAETPGSPPGLAGRAYLFSAPARALPSGFAAVRAQVWDGSLDAPAAFAALRVEIAGNTFVGLTVADGQVLVPVPYPLLEQLRLGSPPGSGQPPIQDTRWPVGIRVGYPPADPAPLAGFDLPWPWPELPSVKPILTAPDVPVWSDHLGPPAATCTRELRYGEELIVRTDGPASLRSRLWVRGTSPP